MNCIEKIIAKHAGLEVVVPGQIVEVNVDYVMTNDATTALSCDIFKNQIKCDKVWNSEKVIMIMDHYTPSNSIDSAEYHIRMRNFAKEQKLKYVYDGVGVCHQLMIENHLTPDELVIGADSHTCNYGGIGALSTGIGSTDIALSWVDGKTWSKVPETIKIVLDGMLENYLSAKDIILQIIGDLTAIEAGANFAFIAPDEKVIEFVESNGRKVKDIVRADFDAKYE